ncbi:hypothetical protein [Chitinivorax sp. B]|uniref:hypothetical protein n=1 Tax=Chitinivorax sp. B TaxID=2502235 RepID=UPI0010F81B49|nr:hypothetical protein [Chitinivorax sp. B]
MSELTSAEWAAWFQAAGSIAAIVAAAWIAKHQATLQHRNALNLHMTEQRTAQVDAAKTLSVLATNSSIAMKHITGQLKDREAIHRVAEGLTHCDLGELHRIDSYLSAVPLHSIPHSLVTHTMVLGSTVRQFIDKTEMALRLHRQLDAGMFDDFFKTVGEMSSSLDATCQDIAAVVKSLETPVENNAT